MLLKNVDVKIVEKKQSAIYKVQLPLLQDNLHTKNGCVQNVLTKKNNIMKKITLENGKTIEISDEKYAELVPVNNKNWRAEKGEDYRYLSATGSSIIEEEENDEIDTYRYNTLNYYRTEEEAEKARERQLAIGIVTRKINESNGDWEADWGKFAQGKYYIYYDYQNKTFDCNGTLVTKQSSILPYIASSEIANKILSENGKELSIIWEL